MPIASRSNGALRTRGHGTARRSFSSIAFGTSCAPNDPVSCLSDPKVALLDLADCLLKTEMSASGRVVDAAQNLFLDRARYY